MTEQLIQQALDKAMPIIAIRVQNELRLVCPVSTGTLRRSIKVGTNSRGLVITANENLLHIEFGSNPHVIVPKTKKSLKFKGDGKTVFAKRVNHPGVRPNPFVRTTIFTKLPKIVEEEIRRVLNG